MKLSFRDGLKHAKLIYKNMIKRESNGSQQTIEVVCLDGELLLYEGKIAVYALFDEPQILQCDSLGSWRTMPTISSNYRVIASVTLEIEYEDKDYGLIKGVVFSGYIDDTCY